MADTEAEAPEVVEEAGTSSTRPTQAAWDKARAEKKAEAAVVVAKNAKAAAKAKADARTAGAVVNDPDFLAKAKEVEDRISSKAKNRSKSKKEDS